MNVTINVDAKIGHSIDSIDIVKYIHGLLKCKRYSVKVLPIIKEGVSPIHIIGYDGLCLELRNVVSHLAKYNKERLTLHGYEITDKELLVSEL